MAIVRHSVSLDRREQATALAALAISRARDCDDQRRFAEQFELCSDLHNLTLYSSATAAFYHAIDAAGWEPGEVLLPEYEFHSVPQAIELAGHRPVYAPVDPTTFLLDLERLEQHIGPATRAVLYLHTFGLARDLTPLRELCDRRGLALIEDCAHAAGARPGNGWAGRWGDISIFSFGDGKSLVCLGGGLVAVRDEQLHQRLAQRVSQFTAEPRTAQIKRTVAGLAKAALTTRTGFGLIAYPALRLGLGRLATSLTTNPLRPLEAAPQAWLRSFPCGGARLGLEQLSRLDELNARRRANAAMLDQVLRECPAVELPIEPPGADHTYLCYAIKVGDAQRLARGLIRRGIDVRPDYMSCLNSQSALADHRGRVLYLPNHPNIEPDDACRAARSVIELL
ncbi:MAG: DegT/DnrJ/EryC1/StrS aminotransferase family protein [Candidatus Alcyoniella australis]|nr:DegT/DnrJ/EryC1/StrS aminotransferase family protein [Candidatus Alcyoniella australis]